MKKFTNILIIFILLRSAISYAQEAVIALEQESTAVTTTTSSSTTTTTKPGLSQQQINKITSYSVSWDEANKLKSNFCAESPKSDAKAQTEADSCVDCAAAKAEQAASPTQEAIDVSQKALAKLQYEENLDQQLAFYAYLKKNIVSLKTVQSLEADIVEYEKDIKRVQGEAAKYKNNLPPVKDQLEMYKAIIGDIPLTAEKKQKYTQDVQKELQFTKKVYALQKSQKEQYQKMVDDLRKIDGADDSSNWTIESFEEKIYSLEESMPALESDKQYLQIFKDMLAGKKFKKLTESEKEVLDKHKNNLDQMLDNQNYYTEQYKNQIQSSKDMIENLKREILVLKDEEKNANKKGDLSTAEKEEKIKKFDQYFENSIFGYNSIPCGMSPAEYGAILAFTSNGYNEFKNIFKRTDPMTKENEAFTKVLQSALEKIKPFDNYVFRTVKMPKELLDKHQIGETVTYENYTSSTLQKTYGNHRFFIKSKTGKYLEPVAARKNQYEVLFKPGTKFKVLSREENGSDLEIIMEEVGP